MQKEELKDPSLEPKVNIRTFRNSPEVESFYRFIHENNLRRESAIIMQKVVIMMGGSKKKTPKKRGRKKKVQ